MTRTPDSITTDEIHALRAEAWEARDYELVNWCDVATDPTARSWRRDIALGHIAAAINEAAAQEPSAAPCDETAHYRCC